MKQKLMGNTVWILLAVCIAASQGCKEGKEPKGQASVTAGKPGAAFGPDTSPLPPDLSKGWCAGHGVPESVCTRCDDSLIEKFKAAGDWCKEHGLPETQCTRCHPEVKERWEKLNPAGKAPGAAPPGDEHGSLPATPDSAPPGPAGKGGGQRLLTGATDPLCQVEQTQIRLRDPSVAQQSGIITEPAAMRRITATVESPGEIAFDQSRLAHVTSRVKGVLHSVYAELGATVQPGDVLAVIESPQLAEAKSRYIELHEKHALAQADFDRAKVIHDGIKKILDQCETLPSTEAMRKAFTDIRVGEVKSRLLTAHSELELARLTFERESRLREQKISSEQEFDSARNQLQAAQAGFHAAHEEIEFSSERDLLAAEKAMRVARSAAQAAQRELHVLGIADEAVLALPNAADVGLLNYQLRSPLAGQVVERHAVVGEAVDEGKELFAVADVSAVWMMLDVPERDLIELRVGLPALATIDGLPGHSFEARLAWISASVDDRKRTVRARAEISNPDGLLRANMFGQARIMLHDNEEVLTVSSEAVQTDGCCQLVFVKEGEALFRPRKVVLGAEDRGYVEIHRGLRLGEAVVTAGSFLMKTEILKGSIGAGCCEVEPGR